MKFKYEFEKDQSIMFQIWKPCSMVETFHWHTSLEIGYCFSGKGWFYFGDPDFIEQGDKELLLPFVYNPTNFHNQIPS
jgi:hypothetical protein